MRCSDLTCMDEKFGPASLFVTFAISEYNDQLLFKYLLEVNPDLASQSDITLARLIAADPVSVSTYVKRRFRAFFLNVILKHLAP